MNYTGGAKIGVFKPFAKEPFARMTIEFYDHSLKFQWISELYACHMDSLLSLLKKAKVSKEVIDKSLYELIDKGDLSPKAFEQLFEIYEQNRKSTKFETECPTILHVLAKHGLKKTSDVFIGLPSYKYCLFIHSSLCFF